MNEEEVVCREEDTDDRLKLRELYIYRRLKV